MDRLRRFLSPQIAELIVSSGEREACSKAIAARSPWCSATCAASPRFSETAEPEEVIKVLREYHETLRQAHSQVRGDARALRRRRPDGLVQRSACHATDPSCAPCAWPWRCASDVGALADKWRKHGHELGFGVGIAQGYATLGRIGFEGRFDYAAIGTVVNLAARLCSEATDGQILIDRKVQAAVETLGHHRARRPAHAEGAAPPGYDLQRCRCSRVAPRLVTLRFMHQLCQLRHVDDAQFAPLTPQESLRCKSAQLARHRFTVRADPVGDIG